MDGNGENRFFRATPHEYLEDVSICLMNEQSPCSFLGKLHKALESSSCVLRSHRKSPLVRADNI